MPLENAEIEIIVPSARNRNLDPQMQWQIKGLQSHRIVELEAVQTFYDWLDDKRVCRQACRAIGDSRTGKTVACSAYQNKHPRRQTSGDSPIVPVVYIHAPTESGPRELFVGILEKLDYCILKGSISELRDRTYRLLKTCEVEMIILDEAHRLRPKTFSEVRDIFDLVGVAVVLVGTDRLDAVVRRDEQVYNRFMSCHRFHRMDSQTLEETTAIWEAYVLKLPKPSNLTSAPMQKLLATSTHGYLGLLDEILRNAARRALKTGQSQIDLKLLSEIVSDYY